MPEGEGMLSGEWVQKQGATAETLAPRWTLLHSPQTPFLPPVLLGDGGSL